MMTADEILRLAHSCSELAAKGLVGAYVDAESALAAALRELERERDEAQRLVKNLAPTGRYNGLDIEQWFQCAEKAERERDELRLQVTRDTDCINRCQQAGATAEVRAEKAEQEVKRLRELLRDCSEKLLLYYKAHPEYVGGQEHSQLQKRIAEALGESR